MFFRGLARQGRRVRAAMDGLKRSRKNIPVVAPYEANNRDTRVVDSASGAEMTVGSQNGMAYYSIVTMSYNSIIF